MSITNGQFLLNPYRAQRERPSEIESTEPGSTESGGPRCDGTKPSTASSRIRCARSVLALGLILVVGGLALGQEAGFQVIVHPATNVESIAKKGLARIFLKRAKNWPSGSPAQPVDQAIDARVRASFSLQILGKSPSAVRSYWNGQVFSGKAGSPTALKSDQEVIAFVRSTPGAVGYVSASTSLSGVKVLRIESD